MKKILIVDDEKSVQFLYEKVFKKEIDQRQFEIIFSISGEDALKKIQDSEELNDYKLVISDINMPGLSGFELLKELKSFLELLSLTFFLLLSLLLSSL